MYNSDCLGISTNILDDCSNLYISLLKLSHDFKVIEIEFDYVARSYLQKSGSELAEELERILQLKANKNLYYSAHAPYIGRETDIASFDENQREDAVSLLVRTIDLSARLGATRFTFHPGYLTKDTEQNYKLLGQLKKSLPDLDNAAQRHGVVLCLENTGENRPSYILFNDKQHEELCQEFGIFLTMDIIHFTSFHGMDSNYYTRLKPILKYVHNVHIADMRVPTHVHLPLGKGNLKFDEIVHFIDDCGYQGNFIVEERGGGYTEYDYIQSAANYRKQLNALKFEII